MGHPLVGMSPGPELKGSHHLYGMVCNSPLGMGAVGASVEFDNGQVWSVADFLDRRSHNRHGILRMAELQVHPAPYELKLQHGAAPG